MASFGWFMLGAVTGGTLGALLIALLSASKINDTEDDKEQLEYLRRMSKKQK